MKFATLCLGVIFVAVVAARGGISNNINLKTVATPYVTASKLWFVQKFTFGFVDRLVKQLQTNKPSNGIFAPILPEFPWIVEPDILPICLPLDFIDPKITLVGSIDLKSNLTVASEGDVVDTGLVIAPGFGKVNISLDLAIPSLSAIAADYSIEVEVLEGIEEMLTHTLLGSGAIDVKVDSVFLKVVASLRAPVNPALPTGLPNLELDIGFQNLAIDLGETTIDEDPISWEELSAALQELFDSIWNDESKPVITEAARCAIDDVINECLIAQLIGGEFGCLNFEIDPACLEPLMPVPRRFTGFLGSFGICDVATSEPDTGPTESVGPTQTAAPTTAAPTQTPAPTTAAPTQTAAPTTEEPEVTTSSGFSVVSTVFIFPLVVLVGLFH